ncbi:carbonate dehydratase [Teredinibacter haidensis]|uniref:carbonate dehydratase n=1 Tax=Teredinibacter haidensis TaxID=2731755 RepID=UPI000948A911|nr:carbonate dehydratase [Teredinibacter haidensis]
MNDLENLFQNNQQWANAIKAEDPEFFEKLSKQQNPEYLWIGCADSRVPANEIVGLLPGELFVHRNIANCVVHTDLNCLCVIYYAVQVLKIKHIIVCGHYGCGGVHAAMQNQQFGLVDQWIRNIRDVYHNNQAKLEAVTDEKARVDMLCELNVQQQVANVCHIPAIQNAWAKGQSLAIHGWIYGVQDGLLKQITETFNSIEQIPEHYRVSGQP